MTCALMHIFSDECCCTQVLKFETSRQPHILGGSVFGYNDAYKRLHSFLRQWRAAQAAPVKSSPPLHQPSLDLPRSPVTQQTRQHTVSDPPEVATAPRAISSHNRADTPGVTTATEHVQNKGNSGTKAADAVPYIVSVDVSRAFDNIDADMLLGIIEPLLRSPEYLIVKYAEV